jgi:serine kinase of HPr protein (carbohydrate metabolism regulator)
MTAVSSETLHASCVSIGGRAVLIEGHSGSGKSDLALRLIDRGAALVADDYTITRRIAGKLAASAPPNITGLIEVRGVGLVSMPFESDIPVALIVTISSAIDRLPDDTGERTIAGVVVPAGLIAPLEASAPIKVELMLKARGLS